MRKKIRPKVKKCNCNNIDDGNVLWNAVFPSNMP